MVLENHYIGKVEIDMVKNMIKKIVPILVVGIMVLSGLGAVANQEQDENNSMLKSERLQIAEPTFTEQDEFTTIDLEQSEAHMSHTGEPMLPVITKTFSFPVGTQINDVNIDIEWEQYQLDRKVTPVPLIMPTSMEIDPAELEEQKINENVYSSTELYPAEAYKVKYGAGIEDMEHVIFINVKCFPQYSPANNYINIPTKIDINVEYETTETLEQTEEEYDLIIITHDIFEDELQPLVAHKEEKGISTKLVTVDEIYAEYESESSYDWEQIKMYLADHVLDWDTKFVLLAGGHKGQTYEWYVPDFRSHCWDPADDTGTWDETYSSDLYYADLYYVDQYGHWLMDTWDTNGNGIYAEGPKMSSGTDNPDYYPDVHVGRLPMRYEWEADVAVNKIINYENNADDSWFKTAVLAGGDGFPPERYPGIATPGIYEGEIVCNAFAERLANRGVVSTKCYCSDEGDIKVNGSEDVYNEVSKGCGFVHLTGHSCPFSLGSYEPDTGISPEPPLTAFYNGFDARQFDCEGKLPFMINEGCHNAQFDVTGQELIDYMFDEYTQHPDYGFILYHYEWLPHDVSSWFVLQEGGGAIALIGNTALGLGGLDYGCTEFVGGWINLRFAEAYGVDGENYTGSVWTTGINGYIKNFDVMNDDGDRKTIEERVLLGDPSLKLGGYGGSLSESEEAEENYGPVSISAPTWSVGDSWTYALDNIDINLSLTEGRGITLKLSSGDIVLEVTDVTSNTYVTSLTADDIDVTIGGMFDFHIEDMEDIEIPTVSLDNAEINGQLILGKESLGIKEIELGLVVDLIENLDNIEDIMGMEFPEFIDILAPYISIPANIDINIAFDNAFEILQFPLENENIWGFPANTVTVTIDGSIESIWLRVLNFVNKFVPIIPEEFAQYLPDIDISEILNDYGIDTSYQIDIPEIPAVVLAYHRDTTALFKVEGSETINTQAGSFNATKISILKDNGKMYYSESEGNVIKIIGHVSDYIPIIDDINLELKE